MKTSPSETSLLKRLKTECLLEASTFVKDFSGNIAGTIGSLTKLLGLG